jgi:hypothetical protein
MALDPRCCQQGEGRIWYQRRLDDALEEVWTKLLLTVIPSPECDCAY